MSLVVEDKSVFYIKKDPEYQKDAVFYGLCKAKTVNCYWGAGGGTDCIYYIDNYNGTYTYYCLNTNKAKQWWDLRKCTNIKDIFQDSMGNLYTLDLSNWQLDLDKLGVEHTNMFLTANNLESITLKGCSDDVVNFFKAQLMTDIPNRTKSGNLSLILDSGTYSYDDLSSEWKIK